MQFIAQYLQVNFPPQKQEILVRQNYLHTFESTQNCARENCSGEKNVSHFVNEDSKTHRYDKSICSPHCGFHCQERAPRIGI